MPERISIPAEPAPWLPDVHDPGLMLLSVAVAIVTSGIALQLAVLARAAHSPAQRITPQASAAVMLGCGIWASHFIALLAFAPSIDGALDARITAASMIPAIAAAWFALRRLVARTHGPVDVLTGGLLCGIGIVLTHHVGMAAAHHAAPAHTAPAAVIVPMLVAPLLATLALEIRFPAAARHRLGPRAATAISAGVMGLAMCGTHLAGMALSRAPGPEAPGAGIVAPAPQPADAMALTVALAVLIVGSLAVAINVGLRYRQLLEQAEGLARQLRQSGSEHEATLRAVDRSMALVEFDLRGNVRGANERYLQIMGYRLDELVGRPHDLLCDAGDRSFTGPAFWASLAAGDMHEGEFRRIAKDGRIVWLQGTYTPVSDADGRVVRITKLATDLTDRRAVEQELREAMQRAETAAAARSAFLSNMSHEIRTPMNAVIGISESLLDAGLPPAQHRQVATVVQAGRSMLRLINDVLDAARLERGEVQIEQIPFDPRRVMAQVADALHTTAVRKGLELNVEAGVVPPVLIGDGLRVQQILMNLTGNAIKFTERGHVTMRMHYRDGTLVIAVSDTGIGIAPEALSRIFEPFVQADASTTRRFGGTGLGTTISRRFAERMGGRIDVASTPGIGSTFTVHLPLPVAIVAGADAVDADVAGAGAGDADAAGADADAVDANAATADAAAPAQAADGRPVAGVEARAAAGGRSDAAGGARPDAAGGDHARTTARRDPAPGRAADAASRDAASHDAASRDAASRDPARGAIAALAPAQRQQALQAAGELIGALADGELAERALESLRALLPAAQMNPLEDALERFDFDRARVHLEAMRAIIGQSPAPTPVA